MRRAVLGREEIARGPLVLVNAAHPLPEDVLPELTDVAGGVLLERRAAGLLAACIRAAGGERDIVPVSGWRSRAEQQSIWDDTWAREGEAFTRRYVALPGCSEHQTGLAVDLGKRSGDIDFIRPDFPDSGACGAFRRLAADYGFTIETVGVTAQSEVTQAVDTLISRGVDCISNLTDNTVVGVLPAILEKTNDAGIPVYGSEVEQVKLGCVAGAGLDYIKLGIQTGQMAAKILRGEATCQDTPYEIIENFDLYINPESLSAMGIAVPGSVSAAAIDVTK